MKTINLKHALPLIALLLVCFALMPTVQAVGPDTGGAIPGSNNGEGKGVLVSRTTGIWNTGTGFEALNHLTSGNQNTATGLRALFSNVDGTFNTATGVYSLFSNTHGFFNNATGAYSLAHNTDGTENNAFGNQALYLNTSGDKNTALGDDALSSNTTGDSNTATGAQALRNNRTGGFNTANGLEALSRNTIGIFNTAVGAGALFFNTTGGNNIALGAGAGVQITTGNNNIDIGNEGVPGESSTIRIGSASQVRTFIAGISGSVVTGAIVQVNTAGQLGTAPSAARFKEEIKPMEKTSEVLFALKPVSFRYKKEFDAGRAPMFGLIAEEVEQVDPDLVSRNEKGEVETVRYEAVNAMLLNEFLKEHKTVQEQGAAIAELKKEIAALAATVKEQASQIQKVSAQVEMSKPAPQMIVGNQWETRE